VTATATGCTATANAIVPNNNPVINITGNATPVTACTTPNGAIDITPAPSGNYTFSWSNSASTEDLSNLAAGSYTVTVSAGGSCTASASFTVVNNTPAPTPTATPTASTCGQNNGAVDLNVIPAGAYTFNWSNNATTEDLAGIPAGTYAVTVTATATGCTATANAIVPNNNPVINITGNATPVTACATPNGAIDITPAPGGNYTFSWSNSASTEDLSGLAAGSYTVTVSAGGSCTASASFTVVNNTPAPTPTATPTPSTCGQNNGAVDLNVTPAGAYTFNWSNNATTEDLAGIPAGTYAVTVTATATGCTATAGAIVPNNNPVINITGNATPVTACATPNGAIDISPAPGGNYTFSWSNSASTEDLSNLAAGSYTVTVSAGGSCTASASFTVVNNTPAPTPTATPTPSTCGQNNGAVDLNVTPAGAYTFNWSNNATTEDLAGIPAGTYAVTVTATATGCTATANAIVPNNNPVINITGNATPVTACATPNGAIDITPAPSGNYTFSWSNSASTEDLSGLAAGSYTVTVSAGGSCTASASFTVVNNTPAPTPTATPTPSTCGQNNGAVDLNVAPAGAYTFNWSNNATTEDLAGIPAGTYAVTVTATATGCTATAGAILPNNNPVINITGNTTPVTACATPNGAIDITPAPGGNYTFSWSNSASTEDLSGLAAGSYTVTVSAGGSCTASASFTVVNNTPAPTPTATPTAFYLRAKQRRRRPQRHSRRRLHLQLVEQRHNGRPGRHSRRHLRRNRDRHGHRLHRHGRTPSSRTTIPSSISPETLRRSPPAPRPTALSTLRRPPAAITPFRGRTAPALKTCRASPRGVTPSRYLPAAVAPLRPVSRLSTTRRRPRRPPRRRPLPAGKTTAP
jgi:acyl CoA:acetate/3-ketoacid CoA transferase beta subunit